MKSKNVVQLHEVNTHTKESIKTTRSKCGGLFVRIIYTYITADPDSQVNLCSNVLTESDLYAYT